MDLIQIQTSDLAVGQRLPWDLFDQEHKQIQKRGHVFKTVDELQELATLTLFRRKESSPEHTRPEKNNSKKFSFQDMQLKVGHRLQLKLSSHTKEADFFTATLFGYVENRTLIVSMPAPNNLTGEPFIEGDQILARLLSGQCVFSFSVFVEKVIKLPFKYLHLSFPEHISGQIIRKSRRIKCNIPASVSEKAIPVTITNISATGAEIKATAPFGALGNKIILSFTITILDKEIALSVQSIIRSVKESKENSAETHYFGVEFTALKTDQMIELHSLICQEIVENPSHET